MKLGMPTGFANSYRRRYPVEHYTPHDGYAEAKQRFCRCSSPQISASYPHDNNAFHDRSERSKHPRHGWGMKRPYRSPRQQYSKTKQLRSSTCLSKAAENRHSHLRAARWAYPTDPSDLRTPYFAFRETFSVDFIHQYRCFEALHADRTSWFYYCPKT